MRHVLYGMSFRVREIVLDRDVPVTHNHCDQNNDWVSHPSGARFTVPAGTRLMPESDESEFFTSADGDFRCRWSTVQYLVSHFAHVTKSDREQQ